MVNTPFLGLTTSDELLSKLKTAAAHKPSQNEIFEQRVSFVFGSIKESSGVTKERVRQLILEQKGATAEGQK